MEYVKSLMWRQRPAKKLRAINNLASDIKTRSLERKRAWKKRANRQTATFLARI